jgi:hypothetical protein
MIVSFSYSTLETQAAYHLQGLATEIKHEMSCGQELYINIGRQLLEAKGLLDHGQFMGWVALEFTGKYDLSLDTAQRWMGVARCPLLIEAALPLSVKYELIDAPDTVITWLDTQNKNKKVTVEEARKAVAEHRFRLEVESFVDALEEATPAEHDKVEETALAVLGVIQQGYDNPRLRDEAKALYSEFGPQLCQWADVTDVDMDNTNRLVAPPTPGTGNGTTVWPELVETKGGFDVVIHVPAEIPNVDRRYKDVTIATIPTLNEDSPAYNIQCQFLTGGAKAIQLKVTHLEWE